MKRSQIRFGIYVLLLHSLLYEAALARTVEFETTNVTAADVILAPDGEWLIFTMLGHLFWLPAEGGTAEQLTFGPNYDTDPAISPDGHSVAFVSDRDGSEGNVFILDLVARHITQITHESWAGRPTWSPDGESIVYLRFLRKKTPSYFVFSDLRRIALSGGEPETLVAEVQEFGSIFYLPDRRLAWSVIERGTASYRATTRIEVMNPDKSVSPLRSVEGVVHRIVPSPNGDGLYCRRYLQQSGILLQAEDLLFLPLPEGDEQQIITVSSWHFWFWRPQFSVAGDKQTLYVGDSGRLWKIALPSGAREPINIRARVALELQNPVAAPKWAPPVLGRATPPRSVMNPQLSPEGDNLVFGAAGYLWQQSLDGGEAQRLIESSAHILQPAMSPDGRQLAFIHSEHGRQEVRLFDFQSGEARTMAYGQRYGQPSWTRDGQRLVFTQYQNQGAIVAIVNLSDGKQDKLIDIPNSNWRPRAHLSADNGSLYYSAKLTDTGGLHRLSLNESAESQPVTNLAHDLHDGLVSPDEKWLAFRRNTEIWVARLGAEPVEEKDVLLFSKEGGQDFVFTSDSSSVIYASGAKIWRQSLAGGEPDEIRIRLELPHPTPPPLLLRQVHMLDFDAGGFGPEVSLLVEQGRISWIGPERGRNIPPETVILEGAGRFAIPGLFDSHVHNIGSNQAAFLAYGITSVRDPGGRLTYLNAMADRVETSTDAGPRYFFSGDIFHGAQPFFIELLRISNADEARTYVRRWKEQGAQFIKVYPDMSWPLKRAVAQEARRLDLPVAGHGMSVEEITNSVTLGFAVLEHVSMNHRLYDDVLQMLAAAGTRWTPTLGVLLGNELLLREEPERLYDPKLRAFATDRTLHNARVGWKTIGTRDIRGYLFEQLAGIRAANDRGVKILAGTDSQPGALLGVTLHWELELFALAGLPPLDLLRIATKEAAATVGAADDLGELEPGKLADIVLLDKNPLEDIRNAKSIWRTVKGGWVYNPDELRPSESIVNGK